MEEPQNSSPKEDQEPKRGLARIIRSDVSQSESKFQQQLEHDYEQGYNGQLDYTPSPQGTTEYERGLKKFLKETTWGEIISFQELMQKPIEYRRAMSVLVNAVSEFYKDSKRSSGIADNPAIIELTYLTGDSTDQRNLRRGLLETISRLIPSLQQEAIDSKTYGRERKLKRTIISLRSLQREVLEAIEPTENLVELVDELYEIRKRGTPDSELNRAAYLKSRIAELKRESQELENIFISN